MDIALRRILRVAFAAAALLMAARSWAYTAANPCNVSCTGPGYPTFTSGNGAVQHPEVTLIFWQDSSPTQQWTANSNTPTMSQWLGYVNQVVNSAYTAGVGQYAGSGYIGRPRFSGWAPIYTGNAPSGHHTSQFTSQDAIDITNALIQNGTVPPPNTLHIQRRHRHRRRSLRRHCPDI